jgi:hypothetical protein
MPSLIVSQWLLQLQASHLHTPVFLALNKEARAKNCFIASLIREDNLFQKLLFWVFGGGIGVRTQGLALARQVLCCLSHASSFFYFSSFSVWPQTMILLSVPPK